MFEEKIDKKESNHIWSKKMYVQLCVKTILGVFFFSEIFGGS